MSMGHIVPLTRSRTCMNYDRHHPFKTRLSILLYSFAIELSILAIERNFLHGTATLLYYKCKIEFKTPKAVFGVDCMQRAWMHLLIIGIKVR